MKNKHIILYFYNALLFSKGYLTHIVGGPQTWACIRITWRWIAGPHPQSFRFRSEEGLKICISNKLPGDGPVAGLGIMPWEPLHYTIWFSKQLCQVHEIGYILKIQKLGLKELGCVSLRVSGRGAKKDTGLGTRNVKPPSIPLPALDLSQASELSSL